MWVRLFGAPEIVICDSGSEFQSVFDRGCELQGIFLYVINAEPPWTKGKGERRGGL